MQALKITAELMTGFASSSPFSPAIDGIIAYQYMREKLGDDEFAMRQHRTDLMEPVEDLPLAKENFGGQWWYQCSFPVFETMAQVVRHTHRRFDNRQAEKYWNNGDKSGKVLVAAGPYKNARLKLTQHITPRVTWYCIGDLEEVKRLVSKTTHIGARVGAGYGRVREWLVSECDDYDKARFHRSLPVDFAQKHGLTGVEMYEGIRPPARHPDNQTLCVMVGYE